MDNHKPDGNLANLVLVYILLQVVLIIFAIIVGDAIGIVVEMLGLTAGKKLIVLGCICALIVVVLYIIRKRLLYHLSFEGISEIIFPKEERQRMLELTKKWKSNSLTEDEKKELQSIVDKTFLPTDVVSVYTQKHYSFKEIMGTIMVFVFGIPLLALILRTVDFSKPPPKKKDATAPEPEKSEGADEDTTPSSDGGS